MSDSFNKSDQHEITKGKVTTAETGLYFRTSNLHMRFLSSLIIIKTVTQGTFFCVFRDFFSLI